MDAVALGAGPEREIRDLVGQWLEAVHAQDLDRIAAHYAPDVLAFDAISQLRFEGLDAYRKHWEACFAQSGGPVIFDIQDLTVAAGDDVAFSYFLNRCGDTGPNGEEKTSWMRVTVGYRRTGGRWRVVHEHFSAPFDVERGEALLDLQP